MDYTPAQFRQVFPAFMKPDCYGDAAIEFWMALGEKLMNKCRWGNLYKEGLFLFTAHYLALESPKGQPPGAILGPVTSGSVDKVSYSRDAASATIAGFGHWNLTTYGLRYQMLVKMVGMGPLQVGPHDWSPQLPMANAWPGVIMPPASN